MEIPRPDVWSNEEWTLLQELMTEDPSWVKAAAHPELFGFDSTGLAMVTHLRQRSCKVRAPIPQDDGDSVSMVETAEQVMLTAVFGARPRLVEAAGAWPDEASTRRVLAHRPVEDCDRYVTRQHDRLAVSVGIEFPRPAGRDLLDDLRSSARELVVALDDRDDQPGAGYDDLVATFAVAGLVIPRFPSALRLVLKRLGDWRWSTHVEDPALRMADYLLDTTAMMARPIEDHVTVSHGGHGANSYALTLRMAFGPIALVVQGRWGGACMDPTANGALAELFGHVGCVIDAAQQRMSEVLRPPKGEWIRPLQLTVSRFRGIQEASAWDPLRGERVRLANNDFWGGALTFVNECSIPDGGWLPADPTHKDLSKGVAGDDGAHTDTD